MRMTRTLLCRCRAESALFVQVVDPHPHGVGGFLCGSFSRHWHSKRNYRILMGWIIVRMICLELTLLIMGFFAALFSSSSPVSCCHVLELCLRFNLTIRCLNIFQSLCYWLLSGAHRTK